MIVSGTSVLRVVARRTALRRVQDVGKVVIRRRPPPPLILSLSSILSSFRDKNTKHQGLRNVRENTARVSKASPRVRRIMDLLCGVSACIDLCSLFSSIFLSVIPFFPLFFPRFSFLFFSSLLFSCPFVFMCLSSFHR